MKAIVFPLCFLLLQGLHAQYSDSAKRIKPVKFSFKETYIPVGLVVAGLLANGRSPESIKYEVAEERQEHLPYFRTYADNYLQFSPIVIAYGLDAFGVKSKTDIANRTAILLKSEMIMYATVGLIKNTSHTLRPDGSANNSFPSGHTAQAFAAATFLNEEYKERIKWMPFLSYGIASGVGALRIANNKHYISDVLVGAGIGILATKIGYWTHGYRWNRHKTIPPL